MFQRLELSQGAKDQKMETGATPVLLHHSGSKQGADRDRLDDGHGHAKGDDALEHIVESLEPEFEVLGFQSHQLVQRFIQPPAH